MPIKQVKLVSKNFDIPNSHTLQVAIQNGRYSSIEKALQKTPEQIVDIIGKSGLRGKGGGGALAGDKWKLMPRDGTRSFLVVNADESEPGTFKDRQIMEYDPHLLIEGIITTCYAIQACEAFIYIRGEYVFWAKRLNDAIQEAYDAGLLGQSACDGKHLVDITLHRGGGAYICGEKSALLESLEGKRGHPRLKPKQKEPEWFFGYPTLVNNVETIASVPYIIENGYEAYRDFGTPQSPGTMLFGMSGHINNPGIYEIQFGESMLEYIETFGGGIKDGKRLKAVIPGGSSCRILTADEVAQARLDYESMRSLGTSLGTGGMIVMDETVSIPQATKNLMEFYHHESCGQCTPCREGCGWSEKLLCKIVDGNGTQKDIEQLLKIASLMNGKTVCVFAPAAADVLVSHIEKFRHEFEALIS